MGNFGHVKGGCAGGNFSNSYINGDEKYDCLADVWEDPGVHQWNE